MKKEGKMYFSRDQGLCAFILFCLLQPNILQGPRGHARTQATVPQFVAEHTRQIAVNFLAEKCNVCGQ
jgi:hypothetical protein